MTITKKDLIYLSVIAVLLFVLGKTYFNDSKTIKGNAEELLKSKGRLEYLKAEKDSIEGLELKYKAQRDSLIDLSFKEAKTRTVIKTVYREKKINILSHSLDSSISYSTRWLSKADTLR